MGLFKKKHKFKRDSKTKNIRAADFVEPLNTDYDDDGKPYLLPYFTEKNKIEWLDEDDCIKYSSPVCCICGKSLGSSSEHVVNEMLRFVEYAEKEYPGLEPMLPYNVCFECGKKMYHNAVFCNHY